MNINEMLSDKSFLVNYKASSKKSVFKKLVKLAEKIIKIDSQILLESLMKREKLGSTAVGNGIAIPHANCPYIEKPMVFVAILSNSLDFNANDDQPVDIIFLLLAPDNNGTEHLQALALVSRLLRNNELTTKLRGCKKIESAFAVISQTVCEKAA